MAYKLLKQKLLLLIFALSHLLFVVHIEACSSRIFPKTRPTIASSSIVSNPVLDGSSTTSSSHISSSRSSTTTRKSSTTTTTSTTTTSTTTTTTPRPNITFPTYKCPATYDAWYCLNEATCFSVKIGEVIMYNCECAIGFMGPRCEYKELDGSLLPKRPRPMLEMASIASGATCAILFVFFICFALYLRYDQRGNNLSDKKNNSRMSRDDCCSCCSCHDKQCCGDFDYMPLTNDDEHTSKFLRSGGAAGASGGLWQHIETLSLSFPIKRSAKI